MNKLDFQKETERMIAHYASVGERPRLLLHACCAPCASYVLEYLTQSFEITVFYYNPNITEREEYEKRLSELNRLCASAPFCDGVRVIDGGFSPSAFFEAARGFEKEAEGGARCGQCFSLRLFRTAEYARENGFPLFATTLTVSPHKNAARINAVGEEAAGHCGGIYLPSDFKKKGGYQRSIELSREYHLYRQPYCGCVYSKTREKIGAER